jgi:hypothetical protein
MAVIARNNKSRKTFNRFIILTSPPLAYMHSGCFYHLLMPLTFSPYCEPWPIEPGRYWEEHSASSCLVEQQITHCFRSYRPEFFMARDAVSHALKVASSYALTEGRDRIVRSEMAVKITVAELAFPRIVHLVTVMLVD